MRALKLAAGVRGAVPNVELGFAYQGKTLTEWYGWGDESFDRLWNIGADAAGLAAVLDEYEPDLVHSHNLPDVLTVRANELVAERIPVVHDVHDLQSLRRTAYEDGFPEPADLGELERRSLEESAAVVTVSPELMDVLDRRYSLPERTLVVPNFALGRDLPRGLPSREHRPAGLPRLVYQGTVSTNGGHYDLRGIFQALVRGGLVVDVYPNRVVDEYHELAGRLDGLTVHEPRPPVELLRRLQRYDFGWAGFNAELNRPHLDTALPNKLFEYLACGLPVLALPHRAIRRLLDERGLGIVVAHPRDIVPELGRHDLAALRRRVAAAKDRLTIEANIHHLVALYEELAPSGLETGPLALSDGEIHAVQAGAAPTGSEPTSPPRGYRDCHEAHQSGDRLRVDASNGIVTIL
jgi:glycosyltransferase involved in cell wall biosynthesis